MNGLTSSTEGISRLALAFALWVALAASIPPPDPTADEVNRQISALYRLKAEEGWKNTPSGLRWRIIKGSGMGVHPQITDIVTIHYIGSLIDGREFDNSRRRGEPLTFPLRRGIKGFREGLLHAGVGDSIELAIPSYLAYGSKPHANIPGGATLLFRIDLLGVEPGEN
jgi:FKBP-type peptidyl-prolyl cis-trans isomerase FkpA